MDNKEIIFKTAIGLSGSLVLLTGFYYGYTTNRLGIKNQVTKEVTRNVVNLVPKELVIKKNERIRIAKQIMRETQVHEGIQKQGFISIPKCGILLPIFDNENDYKGLDFGAVYANRSAEDVNGKKKPIFGESNYCLASHNFNDGLTGFSPLQEIISSDYPYLVNGTKSESKWLNGEKIYLANEEMVYEYTIDRQFIVNKTDISVLNSSNTPKVTIITCLYPSDQYRIITSATLTNQYSINSAPTEVINLFDLEKQKTNVYKKFDFNKGIEEGVNGDAGGSK